MAVVPDAESEGVGTKLDGKTDHGDRFGSGRIELIELRGVVQVIDGDPGKVGCTKAALESVGSDMALEHDSRTVEVGHERASQQIRDDSPGRPQRHERLEAFVLPSHQTLLRCDAEPLARDLGPTQPGPLGCRR